MNLESSARLVVVLGMHRSGTSAITRALGALGVPLGDDLMEPGKDNPRGYWEHRGCHKINEQLLRAHGSSWDDLDHRKLAELKHPSVPALRDQAAQLLKEFLAGSNIWAFKDPRTCRLLSFWNRAIQDAGAEPLYLIVVRNPLSVADSLAARDSIDFVHAMYLWAQHLTQALAGSTGARGVVVDYDSVMAEPFKQLQRIAAGLQLPMPTMESSAVKYYCDEFLTSDLRHGRHSPHEVMSHAAIPRCFKRLYEQVAEIACDQASLETLRSSSNFEDVRSHLSDTAPLLGFAQEMKSEAASRFHLVAQAAEVVELRGYVERLREQIVHHQAEERRAKARLEQIKSLWLWPAIRFVAGAAPSRQS
ncbi:MAG: hypothetical protein EBZ48_01680 [Proteobacteria bacterium]|nr:hypothetical protein [Pseudomonadota bacterium]